MKSLEELLKIVDQIPKVPEGSSGVFIPSTLTLEDVTEVLAPSTVRKLITALITAREGLNVYARHYHLFPVNMPNHALEALDKIKKELE